MEHAADKWGGPVMGAAKRVVGMARDLGARRMPHVLLRLFQTYAVPYGMYACQVWGTRFVRESSLFNTVVQLRHLGFLRYALGVRGSTANRIVMNETCQRPFQFYWLRSVLRYWNKTFLAATIRPRTRSLVVCQSTRWCSTGLTPAGAGACKAATAFWSSARTASRTAWSS
jgi:hypothetical protein